MDRRNVDGSVLSGPGFLRLHLHLPLATQEFARLPADRFFGLEDTGNRETRIQWSQRYVLKYIDKRNKGNIDRGKG